MTISIAALAPSISRAAADDLQVLIIRHGEKPADGDNLSCQGENRALALPKVLKTKFGRPDLAYVPSMKSGKSSTTHVRMLQTVTPFAIKENLSISSKYAEDDVTGAAADVLGRKGLVLMVWEHTQIASLAAALGVSDPAPWAKDDFDSIWIIRRSGGTITMATDKEQIFPSAKCNF